MYQYIGIHFMCGQKYGKTDRIFKCFTIATAIDFDGL